MPKIQVELDAENLERVRAIARSRNCPIERVIVEAVERLGRGAVPDDRIVGMFADEPDLLDAVVESAMEARERDPLRRRGG